MIYGYRNPVLALKGVGSYQYAWPCIGLGLPAGIVRKDF